MKIFKNLPMFFFFNKLYTAIASDTIAFSIIIFNSFSSKSQFSSYTTLG